MSNTRQQVATVSAEVARLRERMEGIIRGKRQVLDRVLVALLAGGHVLIEDLPGMGKTTLAYALARALGGSFQRLQCTSDLLPSDVLGVSIFNQKSGSFEFKQGPVFANFVLVDEINRTTPKTQSALLEVMDRGRVSIDGETHRVGRPFMVFATQNPVDYEGTFPLPESQLDRFLICLEMGYPGFADELEILRSERFHYDDIMEDPLFTTDQLLGWQKLVGDIHVEPSVLEYLLRLVTATRSESGLRNGLSPRGGLALKLAAQANALYHGRAFVLPEDIASMLLSVAVHRLSLSSHGSDPLDEKRRVEGLLRHLLEMLPMPV